MKFLQAFILHSWAWHTKSAGAGPVGATNTSNLESNVDNACAEFNNDLPIGSGWLLSDCFTIWNGWVTTLEDQQRISCPYREIFEEMSADLRRHGNPCRVGSVRYPDGAGSSAVRYLATWMFAEEMGCDWVIPSSHSEDAIDGDGSSLYCHKTMVHGRMHPLADQDPGDTRFWRCEVTNWRQYFRYDAHGANGTLTGNIKAIQVYVGTNSSSLWRVAEEYRLHSRDKLSWDNLFLHHGKSSANRFFQLTASWDGVKRDVTRYVLQKYRESFHEFPRPWYNHLPKCMYTSSSQELNFAIHVRLGDRTISQHGFETDYMHSLEAFMDVLTAAVTRRGFDTPMYHIFTETFMPCPQEASRTFPEFPAWPVEEYQIRLCLSPVTPEDCPEKRAGALSCNPERSGVFRVSDKPLYLHVGLDVQNELTCMTQADGILMGCSTFGQIAGVLNRGLKFFSFECAGAKTPNHYKMMPPLAVAEQGKFWVPISGSWHNPSILSEIIFETALDQYLENNGVSFNKQEY